MAPPRLSALLGGAVLAPRDGDTCPSVVGRVMVRIDVRALSCPGRTWNTSNGPSGPALIPRPPHSAPGRAIARAP
ncbi:hypothetical protein [Streptomyces sp. NPDC056883]|uniref:hypothetical protein n=1 Tax=Streptomyces sp. NPDC056883 TaxID=3345959 RepID=UPI0036ADA19D